MLIEECNGYFSRVAASGVDEWEEDSHMKSISPDKKESEDVADAELEEFKDNYDFLAAASLMQS